jgi:hypothetical protein
MDRVAGLTARRQKQFASALLAGLVHSIADRRAEARWVRPSVKEAVRQGREERLYLVVETTPPATMKAFKRHDLDEEGRLDGFVDAVPLVVVPLLDHAH